MASGGEVENTDPLDRAGQSILGLLQKAGDATDQDRRHALEMAQRLSQELRAAQDRIAQLEDDLAAHRDRAERAELWLDKILATGLSTNCHQSARACNESATYLRNLEAATTSPKSRTAPQTRRGLHH